LFGNKWKTAFLAICLLPVAVLAVSWSLFLGRADLHEQSATDRGMPMQGVLEPGTPPPYNPSDTIPASSALVENRSNVSERPIQVDFGSDNPTDQEASQRSVKDSDRASALTRGRSSEQTSGVLITGQMTLGDIERQTGVPVRELSELLGIPRDASLDDSLGRLRKRHGFSMQQLRDVTSALMEQRNAM